MSSVQTEQIMELVVVERIYERAITDQELDDFSARIGPCFELRNVHHRRLLLSKDRLRAICLYEAPDAAAVREAHDFEGIPYVRIWSVLEPETKS
jgi:hypothetical protein